MEYLRLCFKAPTAHYRIPFTYKVRHSYPIPPYSTVIGLLCNILGEEGTIACFLGQPFGLYIVGRYQTLTREYTWLRNLEPKSHYKRFLSKDSRHSGQVAEHPGGQSPVVLDVLNEVETTVYLAHPDCDVLARLQENLFRPGRWINHLHLGRAEDWVVPEGVGCITLFPSSEVDPAWTVDRGYYFWLPHPEETWELGEWGDRQEYTELFGKIMGSPQLVCTLYRKVKVRNEKGKSWGIRNFNHVRAKLCRGQIPLVQFGSLPRVMVDPEFMLPVFPAHIAWR
ncbi:CRISPR-associated protein Cas5 family [Desulfofundulus kuznetsovii DSM 6115]|uniref:CRISPR-associated protein Cas5 family n=2 Tax=Desulfofundulus kuznetsovii TaxID=58135 RepID=A0AAU8PRH9_DESK7|nr:CRISPR-associated protein Cas5 family [Desulfofundulus kuznetsovii DSM 6115]